MAKTNYTEPTDYIPEDIRRKLKLGEFAEEEKENKEVNKEIRDFVNKG